METLNDNEFKLIKTYQKTSNEEIALYFFNKFYKDLIGIIYYRINKKFSSIPYEKSDLIHLAWKAIKQTMNEIKNKENFEGLLIRNCYVSTIREIRKFLNNGELIMNISYSSDEHERRFPSNFQGGITNIEIPREEIIKNIAEEASVFTQKYKNETVKKVIYLKSIGYSISEISIKLKISKHYVRDMLVKIEKMVAKNYH